MIISSKKCLPPKKLAPQTKQTGFTLIEVVIAMSIMAFLTVMVSQSMRRSAEFKTKVQKNIDQRSAINSAMRIIERDINLAFHYQDVNSEVLKEIEKKKKANTGGGTAQPGPDGQLGTADDIPPKGTGNPNSPIYQNFKIRQILNHTAFQGTKDSIHFTNLNNITIQPGEKVSDQQEVGYYVKSCKSLSNPDVPTKCLWRRTSPYIDDKVDEGGTDTVLIEGVKKFELRYFGKEKEDWVDNWESTTENDDALKNKFPSAVEVTLTVEQNKKEVSAIRVVALRFPNNMDAATSQTKQIDNDAPGEVDYSKGGGN
ncbi:MAG: GspJ family type II secretion system protein [Bdellovibrionota bacterium]